MTAMGKYDPAPTIAAGLIRLARQKAGLTQAGLAERAGITQQVVSEYETGRKEPTLPSLRRLVIAAGYDLHMRLEPLDPHDESIQRFLEGLDPKVRADLEAAQRRRVEQARLERVRGS